MSKAELREMVVASMVAHMQTCHRRGISFADCLTEARRQFNQEVRQQANDTPLPPQ